MTRKPTCVLAALLMVFTLGYSQSPEGLSAKFELGTHLYFGDLNYKQIVPKRTPAYRVSMAYRLSPSFSINGGYQWGTVYGNDRAYKNDELIRENEDYFRSLNFKTSLNTANLLAVYHFDNGKIMKQGSLVTPYIFAGMGLTFFKTYADLYHGPNDNLRYYYWSDGTIRDQPEGDNIGDIISQDGEFETDVNAIQTETGEEYPTSFVQIPVGAGVNFNISKHFTIDASLTAHILFSDNLDDVSGQYAEVFDNPNQAYASNPSFVEGSARGNPNGKNDFLLTPAIGLTYHFGNNKKKESQQLSQQDKPAEASTRKKVDPFFAGGGDEKRLAPIVAQTDPSVFTGRDTVYILRRDTIYKTINGKIISARADKAKIRQFENEILESEFSQEMSQLKEEIAQLKSLYKRAGDGDGEILGNPAVEKLEQELESLRKKNEEMQAITNEQKATPPAETQIAKAEKPTPSAEERISNMRKEVPPAPKGTETAALQSLFEQLAFLNDEIEKLKDKNERFESLLVQVESQENDRPVSPMAPVTSVDGGLGLIYPTLHKERIYFRTNQAFLSPSQKEHLDGIIPALERYPNLGILITGHTDKSGNAANNMLLSRKRAEAVRDYFLSKPMIQEYQVMMNYFGPSIPSQEIQGNTTVSQFDRRVEIDYLKVK